MEKQSGSERTSLNAYLDIENNRELTRDELQIKILEVLDSMGWNILGPDEYVNPIPHTQKCVAGQVFCCHKTVEILFEQVVVRNVTYCVAVPRISYLWRSESKCDSGALFELIREMLVPGDTFRLGTLRLSESGVSGHKTASLKVVCGVLNNELRNPSSFALRLDSRLTNRMKLYNPSDSVRNEINKEPALSAALLVGKPLSLEKKVVDRRCLQFARGRGKDGSDVKSLGVLHAPKQRVGILRCVCETEEEGGRLWFQNLFTHPTIPGSLKQSKEIDSFLTIWSDKRKLGIDQFELAEKLVKLDSRGQVASPKYLAETVERMRSTGAIPVCICSLPFELRPADLKSLIDDLGRRGCKIVVAKELSKARSTMNNSALYIVLVNLALQAAVKAKSNPWVLVDVDGLTAETTFLGVDLGHDHARKRSNCVLTMVSSLGLVSCSKLIPDLPLNEQLTPSVFRDFAPWLRKKLPSGTRHLVLHRDGRVAEEELALWQELGRALQVDFSIIEIKKDTGLRFFDESLVAGTWVELTSKSALLMTSTQSQKIAGQGPPRPIEICLRVSNILTLQEAVTQVFGLCSMHGSTSRHRLPITTERSNNLASSGDRLHTSSLGKWER